MNLSTMSTGLIRKIARENYRISASETAPRHTLIYLIEKAQKPKVIVAPAQTIQRAFYCAGEAGLKFLYEAGSNFRTLANHEVR